MLNSLIKTKKVPGERNPFLMRNRAAASRYLDKTSIQIIASQITEQEKQKL